MNISLLTNQNKLGDVVDSVKTKAFAVVSNAYPNLSTEDALIPTILVSQMTIQFSLLQLPQNEKDVFSAMVKDIIKDTLKILTSDIHNEQPKICGTYKFLEMLPSTRTPGKLNRDQIAFFLATAGVSQMQVNSRIGQFYDLLDLQISTFKNDLGGYLGNSDETNPFWPSGSLFATVNDVITISKKKSQSSKKVQNEVETQT